MKKILLIVNTKKILENFKSFLEEFGYEVSSCDNPSTVLQSVAAFKPDLVLCEASLPGFSGLFIADLLKDNPHCSDIPFLLITSPLDQIHLDKSENIDDLVRLPLNQTVFYGIISKWLETEEKPFPARKPVQHYDPPKEPEKKSKKALIHRGTVNCISITRLTYHLICNQGSGVFVAKFKRKKMKVLFDAGKIVNVHSNFIHSESLGQLLIQMSKITKKESEAAFARSSTKGAPFGQMLIKLGFLSEKELKEILTQQKTMKFMRLFQDNWNGAKYEFHSKAITAKSGDMKPVALYKVLKAGIFTVMSTKDLYDFFTNKSAHTIEFSSEFKKAIKCFQFDQKLIDQTQWLNHKSIDEIKKSFPEHFKTYLRLGFLLLAIKAAYLGKAT